MENADGVAFVAICPETFQDAVCIGFGKGSTVDAAIQIRQYNALYGLLGEDTHILGPDLPNPGRIGAIRVVVARSDEHGNTGFGQCAFYGRNRFFGIGSIKEITGQKHQIAVFSAAQFCNFIRQGQGGFAQKGGLLRGSSGERGIQMPISAVQELHRISQPFLRSGRGRSGCRW